MAEIKKALKNNTNGQAAGCDNIPRKPGKREDWVEHRAINGLRRFREGLRIHRSGHALEDF